MILAHSPADIVRYLLIASELGSLPTDGISWPAYVSSEPDAPDNCITLYDTQGRTDGRIHFTGEVVDHPGVQVRVRSVDHKTGYVKAKSIHSVLSTKVLRTVTIASETYLVQTLTMQQAPLALGTERGISERHIFTINLIVTINP